MKLHLADWVDQHIYATGVYEADVMRVVEHALTPGMGAVDIGANVGFFSCLFAKIVGSTGSVTAFEPQPGVQARLRTNIAMNPTLRIDALDVAASDTAGEVSFSCGPADHSGIGSLRQLDDAGRTVRVRTARADDALARLPRVDLIKIDVEGAETKVVTGLQATIEKWRPHIVVEVSNGFLEQMHSSGRELCGFLTDRGYRMHVIEWNGLRRVDGWRDDLPDQFNALFTMDERRFQGLLLTS